MSNETKRVRCIYDKSADRCDTMIRSLRSYCSATLRVELEVRSHHRRLHRRDPRPPHNGKSLKTVIVSRRKDLAKLSRCAE